MMGSLLFFILAAAMVLSALGVILARNPVRSALCLVTTLFLLAVLFILLDAHLVGALQIVVYAGAIMVLFLFVIMLLNLQTDPNDEGAPLLRMGAFLTAVAVLLATVITAWRSLAPPTGTPLPEGFGTTIAISDRLFTHFLLPFEITSILLLVAVVGAVVLARRRPES
jgi:NADH-quinone oxidoreductase subunit J